MWTHLLTALWVGACGATGAICRYVVGIASQHWLGESFPYGTLAVNVLGCFLMGLLALVGEKSEAVSPLLRTALGVGFLGALTTFSAFGNETFRHLQHGEWLVAALNVAANLALGLLAVWGGYALARAIVP